LQQPCIAAHRTFGAEIAHDLALVASGLSGHLARAASISEPRRTRRVALLVPPYRRRRKLTVRAFGTEGQHCSVGLFLHNKNSHNLSSISVSVKSPLQSFPHLTEAAREPKPTVRPDVVKASEGHFHRQSQLAVRPVRPSLRLPWRRCPRSPTPSGFSPPSRGYRTPNNIFPPYGVTNP
jgi:UDP:flavonoid glycosyltransferase YjiC (YdhE family)